MTTRKETRPVYQVDKPCTREEAGEKPALLRLDTLVITLLALPPRVFAALVDVDGEEKRFVVRVDDFIIFLRAGKEGEEAERERNLPPGKESGKKKS